MIHQPNHSHGFQLQWFIECRWRWLQTSKLNMVDMNVTSSLKLPTLKAPLKLALPIGTRGGLGFRWLKGSAIQEIRRRPWPRISSSPLEDYYSSLYALICVVWYRSSSWYSSQATVRSISCSFHGWVRHSRLTFDSFPSTSSSAWYGWRTTSP